MFFSLMGGGGSSAVTAPRRSVGHPPGEAGNNRSINSEGLLIDRFQIISVIYEHYTAVQTQYSLNIRELPVL